MGTNSAEAVKWFRRSADQGFGIAQFNLGIAYANGDGVTRNAQAAYGWFLLAKAQNVNGASQRLESLAKTLSPTERQAAESWVKDWTRNEINE